MFHKLKRPRGAEILNSEGEQKNHYFNGFLTRKYGKNLIYFPYPATVGF